MTLLTMLKTLKEEHYLELNEWEQEFITDLYLELLGPNGMGLGDDLNDEDMKEYLSRNQSGKLREIAEEIGII